MKGSAAACLHTLSHISPLTHPLTTLSFPPRTVIMKGSAAACTNSISQPWPAVVREEIHATGRERSRRPYFALGSMSCLSLARPAWGQGAGGGSGVGRVVAAGRWGGGAGAVAAAPPGQVAA